MLDDHLGKDERLSIAISDIQKADQTGKFWESLEGVRYGNILLSLNLRPSMFA